MKGGKALIKGRFPVSLAAYAVKPPALMGTKVRDEVIMDFDLEFDLGPAK
ncbi:MAG: hypothetical protein JWP91_4481 [Fibrobacteres bacterium]|nr:hypothetical protein [Fibrobacterota bacterium]